MFIAINKVEILFCVFEAFFHVLEFGKRTRPSVTQINSTPSYGISTPGQDNVLILFGGVHCLKVTIVEFVKKKKKKAPYTSEKVSRLQCVAKKIFRPKEKSHPPCLFNGRSLIFLLPHTVRHATRGGPVLWTIRSVGRIVGPMPMEQ